MDVSEILGLCGDFKQSHIIQNLDQNELFELKKHLEYTDNIIIDTSKYNDVSYESIIKLLPLEINTDDIKQELNRLRLLTDIFKEFKRTNLLLPFKSDYLNNYDRIMNCTTFREFIDNYYIAYDYDDLNRASSFYRFKKTIVINVLINKEFQNIEMQKELNTLFSNNKPYKTNFFLETKGLITYIDSNNSFLKDYKTKVLIKK